MNVVYFICLWLYFSVMCFKTAFLRLIQDDAVLLTTTPQNCPVHSVLVYFLVAMVTGVAQGTVWMVCASGQFPAVTERAEEGEIRWFWLLIIKHTSQGGRMDSQGHMSQRCYCLCP